MNISVKNFKVFENYQNFEIRPLTLLVGPNNTGKSALSKLLQLLKHGTFKLTFDNSTITSFEDAINWEHPDKGFQFTFPAYNTYLPYTDLTIKYLDGYCHSLEMTSDDEEGELISVLNIHTTANNGYRLSLNYKWLIDCFHNDRLYYKNTSLYFKKYNISIDEFRPLPNYKNKDMENLLNVNNENALFEGVDRQRSLENVFKKQLDHLYSIDSNLKENSNHYGYVYDRKFYTLLPLFSLVDNTLQELSDKSYCFFDVFEDLENVTALYEEKIIEIQDDIFSNLSINLTDDFIDGAAIANFIKEEMKYRFFESTAGIKVTVRENRLFELIFEKKMLQVSYEKTCDEYTLWSELLNQLYFLKDNLKRLYLSNATRDISEEYVRSLYDKLENLNISRRSHYKRIFNEIVNKLDLKDIDIDKSVIWITDNNDRKIDIRNLGYGYSKIVPLILGLIELSVEDAYSLYNDVFVIEEPEANLHPDFQSKLAEVFTLMSKCFLSAYLIVETHSEYLIRNLQFLIADNRADKNNSIIYYFNKDKCVTLSSPKVKKITINSDGQLSSGFGIGFYDEAVKLQFELSKRSFNNN